MLLKHTSSVLEEVEYTPSIRIYILKIIYFLTYKLLGRGYNIVSRNLMKILPNKQIRGKFQDGSIFNFELNDYYWNRVLMEGYRYEPELEYVFNVFKETNYIFIDCGANIGYWSVLVSSPLFGNKQCIAVEASPDTYLYLKKNRDLNNKRFITLNNALYSESGHVFSMTSAIHHAANQIDRNIDDDNTQGNVNSITVDDIVKEQQVRESKKLIIKLDVEGQEINALKGASRTTKNNDCLFAYEDHAKDREHSVTKFIMDALNFKVFYIDDNLSTRMIKDVSELDDIKKGIDIGYNFFACDEKSTFFRKLIELELKLL